MARWQPERADVIAEYAREILEVHPRGRLLVGIDGIERFAEDAPPSEREAFATDLAAAVASQGVPAAALPLGAYTAVEPKPPEALYDEARFRSTVIVPYRRGDAVPVGSGDFAPGERGVLVVSGAFLHFGDLAGVWHTSAWLALPRELARRRDAERLGLPDDAPEVAAWSAAVDKAFRRLDARKRAKATFDLTDPAHPVRRFEDAC